MIVEKNPNTLYVKPPEDGKAIFHKVESNTTPGKMYTIRVMPDGEVRCSCPFAVYSKKNCSHIDTFVDSFFKEKEPVKEEPKEESLGDLF